MSKVAMVIKTKTLPGMRDKVRQLFEAQLGPRAQSNEAQQLVIWCNDDKDADVFYLFEIYRDFTAVQANAQTSWAAEYFAQVGPLIASSEYASATPMWAKGFAI